MSTPGADPQAKARGLYTLYRDEKKHEERTKRVLNELEKVNEELQNSKVKLVEKLLDIQVKDEVSRQQYAENEMDFGGRGAAIPMKDVNTQMLKEKATDHVAREVNANIHQARGQFSDGFFSQLDKMVHTPQQDAYHELKDNVDNYVDPHIEKLRRQKRNQPQSALQSVVAAASHVAVAKRRELDDQQQYRLRKDASDRIFRVDESEKKLKKNIGDLSSLLHCTPVEYKSSIGVREAEINDLRNNIQRQKAEEERLLQERQIQLAIIDSEQSKLMAEVEQNSQKLILTQREVETKELDLKEMVASQAPGSGTWATNTIQLERDLSLAVEEEFHLRHEGDEVRKTLDVLNTERAALEADISESISELGTTQNEHQSILEKIEGKVQTEKSKLYSMRESELQMTRKINDLRYRILYRREDIRRQKRDLRSVINTTISQLSIEDRLQSALMARSSELQKHAEKARAQADHHVASLNNQLVALHADLKGKSTQISNFGEQLTNYYAGAEKVKDVKLTAVQLQTQLDTLLKEWARVEWEAASSVAQVASRVDLNTREKDKVLKEMGQFAVLQEDLGAENIDIEHTVTEDLERIREQMYNDVTQRAYREAKYTQCIRMFRERQNKKLRGDGIEPLTRNKRLSLEDRRARKEAMERSKAARQIALEHLKRHNENSERHSVYSQGQRSISQPYSDVKTDINPEFRLMVVNFIKKEILPLYDTNQITKRRFVDIVTRVSSWFIDTHPPTTELTENNVKELVRKIQETITWQDEERLRRRE